MCMNRFPLLMAVLQSMGRIIGDPVLYPALLTLPMSLPGGVHRLLGGVCVTDIQ